MQFNLVNDQEQVAHFVCLAWRGVALRCMALALGFISILGRGGGGCLQYFLSVCVYYFHVALFRGIFGSSSDQQLLCILCMRLRMPSWFCLAKRLECWHSCAF